ncbi:serine/arginine-rich splicing factor 4-like [Uloborus diversus]|uniref:serine/arginine-rich splicing factor 4-like n=1 Tax=Uloborus diversus TaxID=327109 RepID=UPI00240A045B|nr:serine/arginine-rich splicing factor 4-like [Uloborus diversus]
MGTRVYVGRLSYDCRERDLEKFFKGFGKIREILIKNGFGFVEFDDYRDADDAVYELNGKDLLGERIHVEIARGPRSRDDSWNSWGRNRNRRTPVRRWGRQEKYGPPTRTEYRLIVENLSSKVSWQDLKDYMRQAGEVTYADAHKQRRNEGVVEFASYADMKSAYSKLNNTELSGRKIKLIEDRPHRSSRRSRTRSSSRSRSKSRSRSRSRSTRRSRSRSKSASKSRSRSRSRSMSRSRSKSPAKSASKSPSVSKREKSRSVSPGGKSDKSDGGSRVSRSRSRSRSRSKSPIDEEKLENA